MVNWITLLALSIAEVPEGLQRTPYLVSPLYVYRSCHADNVIGDQTVCIISLYPESTPSICIAYMLDASINIAQPTMFMNIGLQNGVLLRTVLDPINGQLTDTRTR